MVEAVWRKLKRMSLVLNNHPRLDFVVHIIAIETVPSYCFAFANARNKLRTSRPQDLTAEQKSFKKAWFRLREHSIKGQYETDSTSWTCGCGAQKYHTHLLCKHLVCSIPIPPDNWWPTALRNHTSPFFFMPGTPAEQLVPHETGRYYWLPRMPGDLPIIFETPHRNLRTSITVSL